MPDNNDGYLLLARLEVEAMRRLLELQEARERRLRGRVAAADGKRCYWVEDEAEEADEEGFAALWEFAPSAWWRNG
jgi:hypothetical protein